jgi:hypothetical protein
VELVGSGALGAVVLLPSKVGKLPGPRVFEAAIRIQPRHHLDDVVSDDIAESVSWHSPLPEVEEVSL